MSEELDQAERLVAEILAAEESSEAFDVEAFLADVDPSVADEVRALHARVRAATGELTAPEPGPAGNADWRYEYGEELGRGGNGRVIEVFDRTLGRHLAMKILEPEFDPIRARRRRIRFRAEAQLAGRLQHPGIVAIHELGRTPEGRDYFTMPKVQGRTLGELIRLSHDGDPAWSRTRLLDVLARVADTLAFAHSRRVVHRDLKPANVMVGAFNETYVLDWGLARPVDRAADQSRDPRLAPGETLEEGLTGRGDIVGTPAYMAPEQAFGEDEVDVRADVYALGACLHELLVGAPPFGRGSDGIDVLSRLALGERPELDVAEHRVPPELEAIRGKAMQADPQRRYADAAGFAADLRAYLDGRVVGAYESGGLAELRKWIRRNRVLAASLAGTALAVLAGVGATIWFRAAERAASLRFLDLQLVREATLSARDLFTDAIGAGDSLGQWLDEAEALLERGDRHRAELELLDRLASERRERPKLGGLAGAADGGWTFADRDERWRHEKLGELVAALAEFEAPGGAHARIRRARERFERAWPLQLEGDRAAWAEFQRLWRESERYAGAPPNPMPGLTPLGIDPASGLLELALVGSGRIPDAAGARVEEDLAVVLAVVPGGRFEFGVEPGSDPYLLGLELPPVELELQPYLLGRHELTRTQWARLVGLEPPARNGRMPHAGSSYEEVVQVLAEWGLELPTEEQWEFAAEQSWPFDGAESAGEQAWLDFALDALAPLRPVGERTPDRFGFGDLPGNLAEFCRMTSLVEPPVGGDPVSIARGGYFVLASEESATTKVAMTRPEWRMTARSDERAERFGVRVARRLGP